MRHDVVSSAEVVLSSPEVEFNKEGLSGVVQIVFT